MKIWDVGSRYNARKTRVYRKTKQHCQVEWLAAFYDEHEIDEDKGNTNRKKYSPEQIQKPLLFYPILKGKSIGCPLARKSAIKKISDKIRGKKSAR